MSDWERTPFRNADEFTRDGLENVTATVYFTNDTDRSVDRVEVVVEGDESKLVLRVTETEDGEDLMTSSVESVQ